ncbi:hypothetical protein JOQ06_028549 [Pogonophryne albipinna]|uniref:Ubiquitin-like domain-containing protein n=1 Tax=Pogonophryne albipinna TaxID=1090488 RepID=A0AAD6FL77_9TELE|nr:hypothetical protein JOQ06_028549 [Pogonophryne albipinna]
MMDSRICLAAVLLLFGLATVFAQSSPDQVSVVYHIQVVCNVSSDDHPSTTCTLSSERSTLGALLDELPDVDNHLVSVWCNSHHRPHDLPVLLLQVSELWEGVKTENDHINLKVAGQDGSVVQFKIKRHTPLSKLMKAYCDRQGLAIRQIRFRFDGQPINETDTPAQLEMEDEDTIDVFQQQTGGHC